MQHFTLPGRQQIVRIGSGGGGFFLQRLKGGLGEGWTEEVLAGDHLGHGSHDIGGIAPFQDVALGTVLEGLQVESSLAYMENTIT